MKKNNKNILIICIVSLLIIIILSLSLAYLPNYFSSNSIFFVKGMAFKDGVSLNINNDEKISITSNEKIDFSKVRLNFYPNANFKYEIDGLPMDFINLYDLKAYERGEGKNINSAFEVEYSDNEIYFIKNKSLNELIEFYKGNIDTQSTTSVNVDYYKCEIVYDDYVSCFTFGDEIEGLLLDKGEVIF